MFHLELQKGKLLVPLVNLGHDKDFKRELLVATSIIIKNLRKWGRYKGL